MQLQLQPFSKQQRQQHRQKLKSPPPRRPRCRQLLFLRAGKGHGKGGGGERTRKEKRAKKEKREVGKGGRGGPQLGLSGVCGGHGRAPRTWVQELVPSSTLSQALAVPWLPGGLEREPLALDTPLFRGPMNTHATVQFVLQRTLYGAVQHTKPPRTWLWVES